MPEPIYLVYIDAFHLDDPLFVPGMARMMGHLKQRWTPCLLVHGSGEQAERLLEAEGLFPERVNGVVEPRTLQEAALVERALRAVNRRIVGVLTDAVVHAVGFHGTDRGLLKVGRDGVVRAGRIAWLRDLAAKRVVPVVSTLVQDPDTAHPREATLQAAMLALAHAFEPDGVAVVFFSRTNQPGVVDGEMPLPAVSRDALPEAVLPDPDVVRAVLAQGFRVLLSSAVGLFGTGELQGTWVI